MAFVCLYHRSDCTQESDEHIILQAFGGKLHTRTLICPVCNLALGSSIDYEIAKAFSFATTLIDPVGRRQHAPTHKDVMDSDGKKFDIGPGGKPSVRLKSLGDLIWQAPPEHFDKAQQIARDVAVARGIDPSLIRMENRSIRPAPINLNISLPVIPALRSACKSAIQALALRFFDEDDRRSDLLLDARKFVRECTDFGGPIGWMTSSVMNDSFVGCQHSILLASLADKSVYWEVVIYGGLLAVSGQFGPVTKRFDTWRYTLNPLTGKQSEGQFPFNFLTAPNTLTSAANVEVQNKRTEDKLKEICSFVSAKGLLGDSFNELPKLPSSSRPSISLVQAGISDWLRNESKMTGKSELELLKELYSMLEGEGAQ